MSRASNSQTSETNALARRGDPTSRDLIETGMQQLKDQRACIDAEAKALEAQAMRLHPGWRRCDHPLAARPWFAVAAALAALLIGAGFTLLVRLAL
jgi:uncharacterized membrane protein YdfJ with MMPL/SSD domain